MTEPHRQLALDVAEVLHLAGSEGPLARQFKGFESRPQQLSMMRNVVDAYNAKAVTLIEAGTGTGKSIAYLIPAMVCALQNKERTLISTHTIALQEQLIHKDIPQLAKNLNIDIKAVLVKGMSNYVCLRKLADVAQDLLLMTPEEAEELSRIEAWADTTQDGSKASLSLAPTPQGWSRVAAERDTCNSVQCPNYKDCFFFKARRQAEDAQILIANHHLLFADVAVRFETDNYDESVILPTYHHIIMDEAHHIEDVATEFFGDRISRIGLLQAISRLGSEKQQKAVGKLPILREKLQQCYGSKPNSEINTLFAKLNIDLPIIQREIQGNINDTFQSLLMYAEKQQGRREKEMLGPSELKLRLYAEQYEQSFWQKYVMPAAKALISTIQRYLQMIHSLEVSLKELSNERFQEQSKSLRSDITALANRLAVHAELIDSLIMKAPASDKVRWIELNQLKGGMNVSVCSAYMDISKLMADCLFSKFQAVILCSATLSTNLQFDFICRRLGIEEEKLPGKKLTESIYDSPFNYSKQALLLVPTDLPAPQHSEFTAAAASQILQAIEVSRGSTFVLFTSYEMMQKCHELLMQRLKEGRFSLFKQGDANRQKLLSLFKSTPRAVLFGTDSFWEGVDVAGEALRCVVIVKLPFRVPTEPIVQARTEAIIASGGNAFNDYTLPNAIVKFKQGFGRLIRHNNDRGCIVCLDTRLITKGYGKMFLSSLPDCKCVFVPGVEIGEQMRTFYRRTHHMIISGSSQTNL